jgi:hypothetical protein
VREKINLKNELFMNFTKQFFPHNKWRISIFLLLTCLSTTSFLQAQMLKSISSTADVPTSMSVTCTAGGLSALLGPVEKTYVENLTVTGIIDARDFTTMRDSMPVLAVVNLTGSSIAAYTGDKGPLLSTATYPIHSIPCYAFCNPNTSVGRISLRTVSLPSTITSIASNAFNYCSGITNISIPSSVASIESWAFGDCGNSTSITIPASVTRIDNFAFQAFNGTINVDVSNTVYSSDNGVLFDFDKSKLIQCPTVIAGSYTIPSSVDTIMWLAFYKCTKLTGRFEIPSSVKSIGDYAFRDCSGITGPMVIPSSVISIGNGAFYWMTSLTSIHVYKPVPVDLTTKSGVFDGINKTNCRLYVPIGTDGDYNLADKWTDFENIYTAYIYLSNNGNNISGSVCWPAFDSIIVAATAPVILFSGSTVNAIAGKLIRFMPGFQAQSGSYMHAYITTNGAFCDGAPGSPVVNQTEGKSIEEVLLPEKQVVVSEVKSIKIYPNPNNGQFTLELTNIESGAVVCIYNMLGAKVYQSKAMNETSQIFNLSEIKRGIYFIKVIDGKDQFTRKMVVD